MADSIGFSLYNQDGYYAVILKGSSGSTITLFGANDFSTKQGFLIIIKRDDKTISIDDLEDFNPDMWVVIAAKRGFPGLFSLLPSPPIPVLKIISDPATGAIGRLISHQL